MIGRMLMGAAALASLASLPSAADAASRYLLVGSAVLPAPGDPRASVFVDVGSASMAGDTATIELVYALGKPQTIYGQDVSHLVYQYQVACAAKSLHSVRVATFGQAGPGPATAQKDPARTAQDGIDRAIVKYACAPASAPAGGYLTMANLLTHAQMFERAQREHDAATSHRFMLTGSGNGSAYGAFDVFMDTGTLEKAGDEVTAQIIEVFQRPADDKAQAGAYAIETVTFNCKARTRASAFNVLYQFDGTPLQSGLNATPAAPIKSDTIDEKNFNLACNNTDPATGLPPIATMAETVTTAQKSLALPGRR